MDNRIYIGPYFTITGDLSDELLEWNNFQFNEVFIFVESDNDTSVYVLNNSKYWHEPFCTVDLADVVEPLNVAVKSVPTDLLKKITAEAKIQVKFGVLHIP